MGRGSLVIALLCALAGTAAAQSAEAETLFREGKKLVKDGKLAEGCAKLDASERIESSTGTLLNLGDCREQNHQLASAWAAFGKAASSAKKDHDGKREAEARRRAKALEGRLGKLALAVATPVDGLEIRRDDQTIDAALWNTDVPVDAGSYHIEASAPGYKTWSTTVTTKDGATSSVAVPALERAPVATKPVPARTEPAAASAAAPHAEPARAGTFTGLRKASIAVAVVGAAGVALGVTFGLSSRDLRSQADALCPMAACPDQHAIDLNKDAQRDALRANIGFAVGGAALVGAVVMWFVGAPDSHEHAVTLAPTRNGFALAGSF